MNMHRTYDLPKDYHLDEAHVAGGRLTSSDDP